MKVFKKVALMGRHRHRDIPDTLLNLIDYLHSIDISIVLEEETAQLIPQQNLASVPADQLAQVAELLIAVGGDGSLIRAAHMAVEQHLPIIGINRGNLGFLTDIYPDEFHKLEKILQGYHLVEKRTLLRTQQVINHQVVGANIALNDVVLFAGEVARMIEFDIYINQQFVCNQRADGLIIASPTGSTAYALSGGGPIIEPLLDSIVLVPMFPHTLSNRPLVIPANSEIDIIITAENETPPLVSCDGQVCLELQQGSAIRVTKNPTSLQLIHPDDYNYFATLREKLGWQNRHRSKNGN